MNSPENNPHNKIRFFQAVKNLEAMALETGVTNEDFQRLYLCRVLDGEQRANTRLQKNLDEVHYLANTKVIEKLTELYPLLDINELLADWSIKQNKWRKATEIKRQQENEKKQLIENARIENAEKDRLAQIEKARLEQIKKDRLARIEEEKIRITNAFKNGLSNNYINTHIERSAIDPDSLVDFDEIKDNYINDYCNNKYKTTQLSNEQIEAIGDVSPSTLLKARAGSGKTTVIKHKIDFLIRHCGYDSNEVMALAFNTHAATKVQKDIQSQFNHLDYNNARTFHSLAYKLVKPIEDLLFDINTGSGAKQSHFIEEIIANEMNPAFQKELYEFFYFEMKEMEDLGSLLNESDYYVYLRNQTQDTLGGDAVKSIGEKWIADFLFEHDVRYIYERSWYKGETGKSGNYYPDFSISISGKKTDIVLEHWGIDENDPLKSVPNHWTQSWEQYHEDMKIKRKFWFSHNKNKPHEAVKFLETSIVDMLNGRAVFEEVLFKKFAALNISLKKLSEEQLLEKVLRKNPARFSSMCMQFIQKAKKQGYTPEQLDHKISAMAKSNEKLYAFNRIANKIYGTYQAELVRQNKIDFDDLMARAVQIVHNTKGNCTIEITREFSLGMNQLKWILIDEYQDFSQLFYNLINAIRQYNPQVFLFCVGDDWQAINGFAGSDLKFFDKFQTYFEGSTVLNLQNNYRSQQEIVEQGNKLMAYTQGAKSIAKNKTYPKETIKKVYLNEVFIENRNNVERQDNPDLQYMTFLTSKGESRNVDTGYTVGRALKACYLIMCKYPENTTFMILSRANMLGYAYKKPADFQKKLKTCFSKEELAKFNNFDEQVKCLTAHKSKGAEADVVIMLNVNAGKYPKIHPDNELYTLVGDNINKILKEEKRLFYVAITRAKKSLYILTEAGEESEFLQKISLTPIKLFG